MAMNKRGGTVTPTKPKAAAIDDASATSVSVNRTFTIPGDGEYESQKVGILVTAPDYETASALCEQYMTSEFERSSAQFAQFRAASDEMAEELGAEDLAEGEEESGEGEGEAEGEAEAEMTADDIRAMDRKELLAINKSSELGIKTKDMSDEDLAEAIIEAAGLEGGPTAADIMAMDRSELIEFNKVNELKVPTAKLKKLADLQAAILEAAGLNEADEAEAGDDTAEDGGEEEGGEAEGEGYSAADIRAMGRKELIALNKEGELGIKSKNMSDEEFADAVIEAAGIPDDGEDAAEEGDGEEEAGDEEAGEEEAAEDEQSGYTRKELEGMKTADLKAIWTGWKIKDKFPTGADPVVKKKALNRIMQFQETGK